MKAYLIDPIKEEISIVDYNGDIKQIQELIEADLFDVVYPFKNQDAVYVDDMGLMKQVNFYFQIKYDNGRNQDLFGLGLVLGVDDEGNSVEPKISLETLKDKVTFRGAVSIRQGEGSFNIYPLSKPKGGVQ
tara:strand:- start:108 stop:500 length:393 start_codon:yes stop_codon:yes gene_type:complete